MGSFSFNKANKLTSQPFGLTQKDMGARNPNEAKSIVAERFVRTIGLNAIRENAAQKRVALGIAGDGSRRAASRRSRGCHFVPQHARGV